MEAAANASNTLLVDVSVNPVDSTFQTAASNNFTIVRAFGHGVLPAFALQPSPGDAGRARGRPLWVPARLPLMDAFMQLPCSGESANSWCVQATTVSQPSGLWTQSLPRLPSTASG